MRFPRKKRTAQLTVDPGIISRAQGSVMASAIGDAMGSQYEGGPPQPQGTAISFGPGVFGHDRNEWTDDTAMSVPILEALANGMSLNDTETMAYILTRWKEWSKSAKDIGTQTKQILRGLGEEPTEAQARVLAQRLHEERGRSGGNGALMRTGPVAFGYLGDGQEPGLIDAATRIAQLTHWEQDNVDACVLWSLMIRQAIRGERIDFEQVTEWLPEDRQNLWLQRITEAENSSPEAFWVQSGWVVGAFQMALSSILKTDSLMGAVESVVKSGGDTDTTAAITGALAGATYGREYLSPIFYLEVHGWPGLIARDLGDLAKKALQEAETA